MNMTKKLYKIFAVPLFQDNYSYVIQNSRSNQLTLVDPANPPVVLDFLKKNFTGHEVSNVLYTHKHWDHAGGSQNLREQLKSDKLKVYIGSKDKDAVPGANTFLDQQQSSFQIGKCSIKAYFVPCHTRGHYIYHFTPEPFTKQAKQINQNEDYQFKHEQQKINMQTIEGKKIRSFQTNECVFTGDTIFSGGVGRFFQGNAQQMVENIQRLSKNVNDTVDIFNGHEYTLSNLKWAVNVEKQNQYLQKYFQSLINKLQPTKQQGVEMNKDSNLIDQSELCTLPTNLQRQKKINLFIRAVLLSNTFLHKTMAEDKVKLMAILRLMKNKNATQFTQQFASL